MNVLISGGAKNGKSFFAQRLAQQMAREQGCPLYYIATMIPHDEEDRARIRRHLRERDGWGFQTLEQGRDLTALLDADDPVRDDARPKAGLPLMNGASEPAHGVEPEVDPAGVFLLDSVTALLGNEMFGDDGAFDAAAAERVAKDCTAFAKRTGNTVFVSDYIYGDADRYEALTEEYRRGLAFVDRELAKICDRVIEVSAGMIEEWK